MSLSSKHHHHQKSITHSAHAFLLECNQSSGDLSDSRQSLEASPAAAEERVADRLARATVLTGAGNTGRDLRLTVGSGVLGTAAARKP